MPVTPGHPLSPTSFAYGLMVEAELASISQHLSGPVDSDTGQGDRPYAFGVETRTGTKRGSECQVAMQPIRDTEDLHGAFDFKSGEETEAQISHDTVRCDFYGLSGKIENVAWEQQNIQINLENVQLRSMGGRAAQRWDQWVFNNLAGSTFHEARGGSRGAVKEYVGGNAVHDPIAEGDTGHFICATDTQTEAAVQADATAVFTLDLVKDARTRFATQDTYGNEFAAAPCWTPWGEFYVCVVHEQQFRDLLDYSATNEFVMLTEAEIKGGTPLQQTVLARKKGVIFHDTLILASNWIPRGINGAVEHPNVRRAVMFGADAGRWLYGENFSNSTKLRMTEDTEHLRKSMFAYTISGFKTLVYGDNNQRWSSMVLSTYSKV